MSVNIPRSAIDPFYRYKRNVIQTQGGKGNNTVVKNIDAIAKQLDRSPEQIATFFRKKLSVNVRIDKRGFIMAGQYTIPMLEDLLEEYIEKYILCPECGNPETTKDGCKACGT